MLLGFMTLTAALLHALESNLSPAQSPGNKRLPDKTGPGNALHQRVSRNPSNLRSRVG